MLYSILWIIAGVASIFGGILALANPLAASLTAELLAGWSFIFVGVIALVSAFGDQGWGARILTLILGALILVIGINLISHPLRGLLSLTYVAGIFMMIAGIVRISLAFGPELREYRFVMIFSGAVSIILSMMIFSNFPKSAAVVLGLDLAIELISNGISMIAIALARKPTKEIES